MEAQGPIQLAQLSPRILPRQMPRHLSGAQFKVPTHWNAIALLIPSNVGCQVCQYWQAVQVLMVTILVTIPLWLADVMLGDLRLVYAPSHMG